MLTMGVGAATMGVEVTGILISRNSLGKLGERWGGSELEGTPGTSVVCAWRTCWRTDLDVGGDD